jgi:hypothetical protein
MVVAQRRFAFLFAAAASAVEQPLLLCSPGGRDGFGSQYFHHMAVFGACAAHGDCCYVHSSFQTLAHGADPRRAEAFTGLRSGDACRHLLSSPRRDESLPPDPEGASIGCSNGRLRREGATAGWRLSTIEWPRPAPKYSLWTFLHNATTRGALRGLRGRDKRAKFPTSKGSDLGHFLLVSADFWTSDHLSERSRSVDVFSVTRARGTLTLKRR